MCFNKNWIGIGQFVFSVFELFVWETMLKLLAFVYICKQLAIFI